MKFKEWIGDPETPKHHRDDYRWCKTQEEVDAWIKKNWEVEE